MNKDMNQEKLAAKKAAVMTVDKSTGSKKWIGLVLLVLVAVASAVGVAMRSPEPAPQVKPTGKMFSYVPKSGQVRYAVADFELNKPRFFQQRGTEGSTVRYFIVKTGDAHYKGALDACGACWSAGKGHRVEGEGLVCSNCQKKFSFAKLGEVEGGCSPIPLNVVVDNGEVVIEISELVAGDKYFKTN